MPTASRTRLELKRQRERLARFERFLPALRLRQQQLQVALHEAELERAAASAALDEARARLDAYRDVLGDRAGIDLARLAEPTGVVRVERNVAGVRAPELVDVAFAEARYGLFGTAPWTDSALADLRAIAARRVALETVEERRDLVNRELRRVVQRVNLFEKVEIPKARRIVHDIRIHLGDEMAAAVGRAKIARRRKPARDAGGAAEERGSGGSGSGRPGSDRPGSGADGLP